MGRVKHRSKLLQRSSRIKPIAFGDLELDSPASPGTGIVKPQNLEMETPVLGEVSLAITSRLTGKEKRRMIEELKQGEAVSWKESRKTTEMRHGEASGCTLNGQT